MDHGGLVAGLKLAGAGAGLLVHAPGDARNGLWSLPPSDDQLRAELWEIDENLMRAELSPAQQAEHLHRRKEVWLELGRTNCPGKKPQHQEGFATDTARASGVDARTVRRDVARAEALGPDLKLVAGTSLDKGVELDALAKMQPAERAPIIQRAVAGEAVTARAPMRDDDVIEKQVNAVMAAWNKACPEARDRVRDLINNAVFDRTRAGAGA